MGSDRQNGRMSTSTGDFALTTAEIRVVASFALASAEEVLGLFETACPDDGRPRSAIEAARAFAEGAPRSNLQRVTSTNAHRAAREVTDEAAAHAARAAGDAAAAAYLHPLAQATQVGHILRASAHAARALELSAGGSARVGDAAIERAGQRATDTLVAVLCRYPPAPTGRGRVAELMSSLDSDLRAGHSPADEPSGQGWCRHGGDQGAAIGRALRFVQQEFPLAQAAFLGGSVATGHATTSSDLDLLVVLPERWVDTAFVETSRFEGQLVEAFVYGRGALSTWLERGRSQHRPVLDRLAAEGIPLINGPLNQELGEHCRAVLDAGPEPADPDDLARRAYSLSAHLDDLADRDDTATTDPAERAVLAWTLWREAAELSLLADRQWLGSGKWLVRELRRSGDISGLAEWVADESGDIRSLVALAERVLDRAGGYLQDGFLRGERPTDL